MPKVDMIATKDFGYNTRRLKAGDEFPARNTMDARILERVRRVAEPKPAKEAAPILATEEVLEAEVVEEKRAAKPSTQASASKPGGSRPGQQARRKKNARK